MRIIAALSSAGIDDGRDSVPQQGTVSMTDVGAHRSIPRTPASSALLSPLYPASSRTAGSDRLSVYIIVSSLLIVLGFKFLLIGKFNPLTPLTDQWDAEAALLYKPVIEGHFNPAIFIAAHNEHRILFTRIINLAVFYGVGLWYPALQMVVNSFIHCATIFTIVYLLTRCINIYARSLAIILLTFIYIIPFDVQNTLAGFQSQFYLLALFSISSVYMISRSKAFSGIWLVGLALSVASYFNMASGSLTAAAAGTIMTLQLVLGCRQRTAREYVAVPICMAISVIAVMATPYGPEVASYKVQSLYGFAIALIKQASYPFSAPYGLLQYIPSAILIARIVAKKPGMRAYEWSAFAILVWLGSQLVAMSYGRGNYLSLITTSRYTDTLILGFSVNLSIAFYLLGSFWSKYFPAQLGTAALSGRWLLLLFVGTAVFGTWAVPFGRAQFAAAEEWGEDLDRQNGIMEEFFRSGDSLSVLQGKPYVIVLPYPIPERLAMLASDPTIQSIMHPALTHQPLRRDLLLPLWLSKFIRDVLLLLMQSGQVIIGVGIGMWLAIPAVMAGRSATDRSQTRAP